jgi:hypothetical protein
MTPAPQESAAKESAPSRSPPNDLPDLQGEDPIAHRCMQYLLGELSAPESVRLEGELKASPAVNRELLVQADLLCVLAASQASGSQLPSVTPLPSPDSQPSTGFTAHARHWVMIVAVTAACLAVAIAGFLWQREDDLGAARLEASDHTAQGDEALLIARAWATSHVSQTSVEDWGGAEGEVDLVDDQPADDDSFLAWMVVAVAADAEVQSTASGVTSDG